MIWRVCKHFFLVQCVSGFWFSSNVAAIANIFAGMWTFLDQFYFSNILEFRKFNLKNTFAWSKNLILAPHELFRRVLKPFICYPSLIKCKLLTRIIEYSIWQIKLPFKWRISNNCTLKLCCSLVVVVAFIHVSPCFIYFCSLSSI